MKDPLLSDYDACLFLSLTNRCNLNCAYCVTHDRNSRENGGLPEINIPAFVRALEKTGKVFKIRFAGGGEPFLIPNLVEACAELTRRHYVGFTTNLTCANVREFAEAVDPRRVSNIHASLHVRELEDRDLTDRFSENFLLCKRKGFPVSATVVAYPPLLERAEAYRTFFGERGIDIFFGYFVGTYNGKRYPAAYTEEEIRTFGLSRIGLRAHPRYRGLCNAGFNIGIVWPDGNISPCLETPREILGNIYDEIRFNRFLKVCPVKSCDCPLKQYDKFLFERAVRESLCDLRIVKPLLEWGCRRLTLGKENRKIAPGTEEHA